MYSTNIVNLWLSDLVAQLVEHVTFNHRALGSSPNEITYLVDNESL